MPSKRLVVENTACSGLRVDKYIAEEAKLLSRSQLKSRLVSVRVNGTESKLSRRIDCGDVIEVNYEDEVPADMEPEDLRLSILFENDDVIVLDKAQGMVVHPAAGNPKGTLVQGLLHHCAGLTERFPSLPLRPGIVHRLDKETSGVIIAAKTPEAHEFLSKQFRDRSTEKVYVAVVVGNPAQGEGIIETFLKRDPGNRKRFACSEGEGKRAVTYYRVMRRWKDFSLVLLSPKTGRTHQLRGQMLHIGHPIAGDPVYGKKNRLFPELSLMLHAYRLTILLPGERERRCFIAPIPERFRDFVTGMGDASLSSEEYLR